MQPIRSNRTRKAKERRKRRLPKKLQDIPPEFFDVLYPPEDPGTAMAPSMATGSSQDEDIPLDDSENDSTSSPDSQNGSPTDETERDGTDPAVQASQFYPDDMAIPMEQGSYDIPAQLVLDDQFCAHCHPSIPSYHLPEHAVFNQNHHEWPVQMTQYHSSGQSSQHPIGTPSWNAPHIASPPQNNAYFGAHTGAMDESHYHSSHDVYTLSAQIMQNHDYAARSHHQSPWVDPSQDESGNDIACVHDEEQLATNVDHFVETLSVAVHW